MKKFARSMFFAVLSVLMILQTVSFAFAAEVNKNDAVQITADGEKIYGTIAEKKQVDWYYFETGAESEFYYFTLHNESGSSGYNMMMYLYTDRNEQLIYCRAGQGKEDCQNIKLSANATYYFCIYDGGEGTGNYYFSVYTKADDVGDNKDAATEVALNTTVSSTADGVNDKDYFRFTTGNAEKTYTVKLANNAAAGVMMLYLYSDRDEELVYCRAERGYEDSKNVKLSPDSTYYLYLYCASGGVGEYSFVISECADGHTAGNWTITKEPTCAAPGERTQYCSVCGDSLQTEAVAAKGHSLDAGIIQKKASVLAVGKTQYTCTVCGEVSIISDWSQIWILPAIAVVVIFVLICVAKRKAAKARVERKAEEERNRYLQEEKQILLREKKYKEATSQNVINENLMREAAKLGSEQACIYVGSKFIRQFSSGRITNSEKISKAAELVDMFKIFGRGHNPTGKFMLIYFTSIADKINKKDEAMADLQSLRNIINTQEIPVWLVPHVESAIKSYVEWIDNYREPVPYTSYDYSSISSYSSTSPDDDSPYALPTAIGWTDSYDSSSGTYTNADGLTVQLDGDHIVDENGYIHVDVSDL